MQSEAAKTSINPPSSSDEVSKDAEKNRLKGVKLWLKSQRALAGHSITLSIILSVVSGCLLIVQAGLLAHIVNGLLFTSSTTVVTASENLFGFFNIDKMIWQTQSSAFNLLMLALLLVIVLRVTLARGIEKLAFAGADKIKRQLRLTLYRKLMLLGPRYVEQQRSAAFTELLHQGVEALEDYYARYLPAIAFCAIIPLAILAVVLPTDWLTAVIFLVTAPLIPFFMIMIGVKAEQLNQKHWQQLSRMSNHFLDVLQGIAHLKLFNASRAEGLAIARIADQYRKSTLSVLKVAFLSSFALEFLATVSIALVAVTVGFRLYWGELDFSIGFMLLLLAPEFYLPFRQLGTHYHAKMKGVAAAERMVEILQATPQNRGEAPFIPQLKKQFGHQHWQQQSVQQQHSMANTYSGTEQPPAQYAFSISLQNISFDYQIGRRALHNVSLQITQPGLYGIVGSSGSGKSTLIDLLLGFLQPSVGTIHINQQLLLDIERSSWQQQLAWIPQNPQLIYGTILDNIILAKPDASQQEVTLAAQQAGIESFIQQLPLGWQQVIDEQGKGISGGQRQRIALARAFLKQAPLLILDEPSAHLDKETERAVQQAISDYAKENYVIVVAHRLETIRDAKCIYVLAQGELEGAGKHSDLQQSCPAYQQLIQAAETSSEQE